MLAVLELLDPERRVAAHYLRPASSSAVVSLWGLDAKIGQLLGASLDPQLTLIKLAWWREALEALDGRSPPPEPVLSAIAEHVLTSEITGAELAQMITGWEYLVVHEQLSEHEFAQYAAARGGLLFRYSAQLLGPCFAGDVNREGEGWALVDLARHSSSEEEAAAALAVASEKLRGRERWPMALRPLGMLAILARRDAAMGVRRLEQPGSRRRMLRMLRHQLTGR